MGAMTLQQAATEIYQQLCDHRDMDGDSVITEYIDSETGFLMGECRLCGHIETRCMHPNGTYPDEMSTPATATEPPESWIVDRCVDCHHEIKPEYDYAGYVDDLPY